jgi:organic hydroperoxide reductase OsmC/OhrA
LGPGGQGGRDNHRTHALTHSPLTASPCPSTAPSSAGNRPAVRSPKGSTHAPTVGRSTAGSRSRRQRRRTPVPAQFTDPSAVDPEEGYVASIASCHLLSFLPLAALAGFEVLRYEDDAVGRMTKNERGKLWVSEIDLSPRITWKDGHAPSAEQEAEMHHRAHEECYIANSVRTEIRCARRPPRNPPRSRGSDSLKSAPPCAESRPRGSDSLKNAPVCARLPLRPSELRDADDADLNDGTAGSLRPWADAATMQRSHSGAQWVPLPPDDAGCHRRQPSASKIQSSRCSPCAPAPPNRAACRCARRSPASRDSSPTAAPARSRPHATPSRPTSSDRRADGAAPRRDRR